MNVKLTNMEAIDKLTNEFRLQQLRLAYFIIAVNMACIGYCIDKSNDVKIEWTNTPLALSILFFGLSSFLGIYFVRVILTSYPLHIDMRSIENGTSQTLRKILNEVAAPEAYTEGAKIALASAVEIGEAKSATASRTFKWMFNLLYLAILCFIAWRVIISYKITFG